MAKKWIVISGCLLTMCDLARASSPDMDFTLSGSALFTNSANKNGVHREASTSGGLLASYRYYFSSWGGVELNYGHSSDTQSVQDSKGGVKVSTDVHEVTGALVFRFATRGSVTPYLFAGAGLLQFNPNTSSIGAASLQSQNRTAAVYGMGIDYTFAPHWSLRAQYRGLFTTAPSFNNLRFRTDTYLHTAEPTLGISYIF
jgi:outer membrane immunogenic protein